MLGAEGAGTGNLSRAIHDGVCEVILFGIVDVLGIKVRMIGVERIQPGIHQVTGVNIAQRGEEVALEVTLFFAQF